MFGCQITVPSVSKSATVFDENDSTASAGMIFVRIARISQRCCSLKLVERPRKLISVVQNCPDVEMGSRNQRALQRTGDCLCV